MISVQTAYTLEIDEVDGAIDEILAQLDLDALKKNNVGLVSTYYDFIESGVVGALCERLNFDVVGMTTLANATHGNASMYALTLTVLSSDDATFVTALTPPLSKDNYQDEIESTYKTALAQLPGDPAFIISYLPYIGDVSGADLVRSFDKAASGIPIFGSLTFGIDVTYEQCRSIWNDKAEQFSLSMLLIYGDVNPDFITISIPGRNIRANRVQITDSDRCVLKGLNGMPPLEYLSSVGIELRHDNASTLPILVYYEGETEPTALGVFKINDDGSLLCGGEVPTGATVALGSIDAEGIVETAKLSIDKLLQNERKSGMLLLPCVTRYIMLAPGQNDEMIKVAELLDGGETPYSLSYSGGEVCPVRGADGKWNNRFHNYTFSACIL
jgi:hypothetical protein